MIPFDDVTCCMIEVLWVLNKWIKESNLTKVYRIVWYCSMGMEVQRFVKTFLEYSKVGKAFDEVSFLIKEGAFCG